MQLKTEREAEGKSRRRSGQSSDVWTGAGPAAKSHLKELTRLMEGARTEAGKNFSQLLQKLDNIKQASGGGKRIGQVPVQGYVALHISDEGADGGSFLPPRFKFSREGGALERHGFDAFVG